MSGFGAILQERLNKYAAGKDSWLKDIWLKKAYLEWREPSLINVILEYIISKEI